MSASPVGALLHTWSLEVVGAERRSIASRVVPVRREGGEPAYLKLGTDPEAQLHEVAALRWYDGRGAVRVLEVDSVAGAMLLEPVEPGEPLAGLAEADDDEATMALAAVMGRLWSREGEGDEAPDLPTIAEDVRALGRLRERHGGRTGPIPADLVGTAESVAADLERSTLRRVVLHGDLHHGNVLSDEIQRWVAIDPKGRLGDPAAEAAALLRNPLPLLLTEIDPTPRVARRVDLLSELLQIPRDRLIGWGLVLATVAACWQLEDEGAGWEPWVRVAQAIGRVR